MSPPVESVRASGVTGFLTDHGTAGLVRASIALATLAVVSLTAARVAVNAPGDVPLVVELAYPALESAAVLLPAIAAVVLGLRSTQLLRRVGLVAIGAFAALSAVVPAASVAASGAIVAGCGLAAAPSLEPRTRPAPALVVGVFLVSAVAALGGAMDLLPPGARSVGSTLAFLGLAGLPAVRRPTRAGWLLGGAAFALVLFAGASAPYVTGAVVLVAGGAVGVSLLTIGLGLGGGVAATAGARSGHWGGTAGVVLLLAAGVPATVPRALAVAVGLVLLLEAAPGGEAT